VILPDSCICIALLRKNTKAFKGFKKIAFDNVAQPELELS